MEVASGLEHRRERLRAVARPHLEGIQRATGETVNLVVLEADRVVYIDQVEGSRNVRMFTTVGTSVLAHSTGSGKAIMAFGPPEAPAALYGDRELERLTKRTLTTLAALEDDFKRIRRRGYALDNEEHEEGVGCVAAPVFDHTGRPCAAISVSGPTARILHEHSSRAGCAADRARRDGVRGARLPRGRLNCGISAGGIGVARSRRVLAALYGRKRRHAVCVTVDPSPSMPQLTFAELPRPHEIQRAAQVRDQHGVRARQVACADRAGELPVLDQDRLDALGVAQQRRDDHALLAVAQ